MNKRHFLKLLAATPLLTAFNITPCIKPKFGYINLDIIKLMGSHAGDWTIKLESTGLDICEFYARKINYSILAANDKTKEITFRTMNGDIRGLHLNGEFRIVYVGKDPRFKQFSV